MKMHPEKSLILLQMYDTSRARQRPEIGSYHSGIGCEHQPDQIAPLSSCRWSGSRCCPSPETHSKKQDPFTPSHKDIYYEWTILRFHQINIHQTAIFFHGFCRSTKFKYSITGASYLLCSLWHIHCI